MSRTFSELVVEGPFMLVKGFVVGFLAGTKPDGEYFFHRKVGIRRETLKGFLKEFFELDNHVHLCLEDDLLEKFKEAAKLYEDRTGMKIQSIKSIKSAGFSFAYEIYNEEIAGKVKHILTNLPEGVELKNYHPYEQKDKEGHGVEAFAPLHEFTSRAKGSIEGDFEGVMEVFLEIKRSEYAENVICDDVRLELK